MKEGNPPIIPPRHAEIAKNLPSNRRLTLQDVTTLSRLLEREGAFQIATIRQNSPFTDSPRPQLTLTKAAETKMWPMGTHYWVRDHTMIGLMLIQAGSTSGNEALTKEGKLILLSCLDIMSSASQLQKQDRIINSPNKGPGKIDLDNPENYPQVFLNRNNLDGSKYDGWSHKQDAWQMLVWSILYGLEHELISMKELSEGNTQFLSCSVPFLAKIRFWKNKNSGSWEELSTVRASTLGWEVALLQKIADLETNPAHADLWQTVEKYFNVYKNRIERDEVCGDYSRLSLHDALEKLTAKGCNVLNDNLPYEDIKIKDDHIQPYEETGRRNADAAQLLLLLIDVPNLIMEKLGRVEDDAQKVEQQILDNVLHQLETPYGIRRYLNDSYQGPNFFTHEVTNALGHMYNTAPSGDTSRISTFLGRGKIVATQGPLVEAAWQHFVWQVVLYFARKYNASGEDSAKQQMERYFRKGCGLITGKAEFSYEFLDGKSHRIEIPAFRVPEAYIVIRDNGKDVYIPSPHTPLNWATATARAAFAAVEDALRTA